MSRGTNLQNGVPKKKEKNCEGRGGGRTTFGKQGGQATPILGRTGNQGGIPSMPDGGRGRRKVGSGGTSPKGFCGLVDRMGELSVSPTREEHKKVGERRRG